MRFNVDQTNPIPVVGLRVGDVFPVRGGRNRHCRWVVIAIDEDRSSISGPAAIALVINPQGAVIGCASYGVHYFDQQVPIGRVEGLEDLEFVMQGV